MSLLYEKKLNMKVRENVLLVSIDPMCFGFCVEIPLSSIYYFHAAIEFSLSNCTSICLLNIPIYCVEQMSLSKDRGVYDGY